MAFTSSAQWANQEIVPALGRDPWGLWHGEWPVGCHLDDAGRKVPHAPPGFMSYAEERGVYRSDTLGHTGGIRGVRIAQNRNRMGSRPSHPVVLLAEDDQQLRQLYRVELELRGFEVEAAGDGLEALELLDEGPVPNAVVLDVMMPRVDGVAVAQELRAHQETRRVPIVALTGTADPFDESAFTKVLRKPVDPNALASTLDRFVSEGSHKGARRTETP